LKAKELEARRKPRLFSFVRFSVVMPAQAGIRQQ
jgi:hypothetical protein